ncbi:2-oxo-4-hydroxy-4-carboxy-5-ureidoimidazoline decarboxylase [Arthrobacter sp. TMP15]|uniref:2-oxo-4-hydroxy-4-carboxy-5-ureidoimidazoline decarboxylase n=1 Tax=Arthrobacter sp. TMP15 TaxID=3140789 RepID=UPI0031BA02B7
MDASNDLEGIQAMLLEDFNHAARTELEPVLRPCIDIQRWIDEIITARPFATINDLLSCAGNASDPFTTEEIASAMAHHPRIGQRAPGTSTEATLSRSEQAGVDPTDPAITTALTEGNRAYEARFNQVFLIRAAGRSPQEIINTLHQRLKNTPEEENLIVAGQLREIAVLRLQGVINA